MSQSEERMRILKLVESGQVSAEEGAQLLGALESTTPQSRVRAPATPRTVRVRVTDLHTHRQKVNVTIPSSLISIGIKLGTRLVPGGTTMDELLRSIDSGTTGRVYEVRDLEEGEQIEIFVE